MSKKTDKPKSRLAKIALALLVLCAIAGLAGTSLLYVQHREDQKLIATSGVAAQAESQELVKEVSRLMLLPTGEKPTVATVSDYRKLNKQAFFKNARNGDKVLIYAKAKMAIMYSPKQNLILAVGPLNVQSDASSPAAR